eukprot:TRINITY_DN2286_c0_g1_i1.p2 TRINITY_DN2286_c0_g1~~TRINITY_DN2286_c0_g1_i1.p2  ORF type:complete len:252 (+),score=29.83 TRINITY_DN2286_c0_g1_i1:187-942(+)
MTRKEMEIDAYSLEQIIAELKGKKLPSFGTPAERKDRLKKAYGIITGTEPFPVSEPQPKLQKKSRVVERIEVLKQKRDDRRKKMEEERRLKYERLEENQAAGKMGDIEFELMVEKYKLKPEEMLPHISPEGLKINVCVRKRPIFKKELSIGEIECVSVANPRIIVHECNYKVDGITKYVEDHEFRFDNVLYQSNKYFVDLFRDRNIGRLIRIFYKAITSAFVQQRNCYDLCVWADRFWQNLHHERSAEGCY